MSVPDMCFFMLGVKNPEVRMHLVFGFTFPVIGETLEDTCLFWMLRNNQDTVVKWTSCMSVCIPILHKYEQVVLDLFVGSCAQTCTCSSRGAHTACKNVNKLNTRALLKPLCLIRPWLVHHVTCCKSLLQRVGTLVSC